ncbi:hypothetical protein ABW21_db0209709 [Orbilia brochopaga]|nr:hypothetical protein ABW21_db0209709 [Drechslerella brochopaga]
MTHPAEEKKSPFDLSTAIDLFRSLSSYPTKVPSAAGVGASVSSQLSWFAQATTSSDLQDKVLSRPNPFLEALSSPLPPALPVEPRDDEPTTPVKLSRRERRLKRASASLPPTLLPALSPALSPEEAISQQQPLSRKAREEAWQAVLFILQKHAEKAKKLFPRSFVVNENVYMNAQMARAPAIHIFVDYSNISIGFSQVIKSALAGTQFRDTFTPQISFATLARILQGDRGCRKKALAGSSEGTYIAEARRLGYDTSILQRVPVKTPVKPSTKFRKSESDPETFSRSKQRRLQEQAVDEVLIMKIQDSLLEHLPSTIVLATGDGNIAEFSDGFFGVIERALRRGWNVELFAFHHSLSSSWKRVMDPKFRIILLDSYLPELARLVPNMPSQEKRKRETGDDSDVQKSKH